MGSQKRQQGLLCSFFWWTTYYGESISNRKTRLWFNKKSVTLITPLKEKEMSANFQNGSLYSKKIEKKENPEKIMRMKHQNHHILQSNHTSNLILKLIVQLITSILPFYMKAGKNIIQMLNCFFQKKKKRKFQPKIYQANNTKSISKTFKRWEENMSIHEKVLLRKHATFSPILMVQNCLKSCVTSLDYLHEEEFVYLRKNRKSDHLWQQQNNKKVG